jgi:hypothetical protein
MHLSNSALRFLISLGVTISAWTPCHAQSHSEDSETRAPQFAHVLNGHTFLPSFGVAAPFANSTASTVLGVALGNFTAPTATGDTDIKLAAFSPQFEGQIRAYDRLAISLGATGNIVTGINGESALRYGASTSYKLSVGALYELIRDETKVISVALTLERPHTYTVSPLETAKSALRDALGGGGAEAVQSNAQTDWRPNLRAAYAFNPVFGIRGLMGMRFTALKEDEAESSQTRLNLGFAVDTDLKPWIGFPVGFTVNYLRNQTVSAGAANSDTLTLGIFETFAQGFNLGLETGTVRSASGSSTLGALIIRTYYN